MKKKILLCLSVLILAASCGQSVINSNKESEVANQQKIVEEPFTGQTYDLNQTDFNLDINNLLYYKGSIFNGRVKFKTTAGEGYYTFQNGALNGALHGASVVNGASVPLVPQIVQASRFLLYHPCLYK